MASRNRFSVDQAYRIGELRQDLADLDVQEERWLGREAAARSRVEDVQEKSRLARHDLNELLEAATENK